MQNEIEQKIYSIIKARTSFTDSFSLELTNEIAAAIAPLVEPKDYPYNELFDHMANEHGLTLTNTELGDIIHVVKSKKMSDNEVSLNRYIFKLTKDNIFLCFKKIDAPNAINARNKLVRRIYMKPKYKGVRVSLFKVLDGTFTKTIWEFGDENDPK